MYGFGDHLPIFGYILGMKSAEIHILTDEIINKIAAGEVIERPASAVKELIENAIDAGASRIQVQIEQGGKKKILVSDNGKGMGKADLDLCYLRHTTSKLVNADDLFHLQTNGFRGEAVASIAAVSKMTITTANDDGESTRLVLLGGSERGFGNRRLRQCLPQSAGRQSRPRFLCRK